MLGGLNIQNESPLGTCVFWVTAVSVLLLSWFKESFTKRPVHVLPFTAPPARFWHYVELSLFVLRTCEKRNGRLDTI